MKLAQKHAPVKYIAVVAAISKKRGMIAYWLNKEATAFNGRSYRAFLRHVIAKCKRKKRPRLE